MKKVLLGAILVLVVVIGVGVYYLLSNLDAIVKQAIETHGSAATQTAVRVESVKIDLQDGAGAVRGLTVGNPQGFSSPQVFSLGEIATQVNLKSLTGKVYVIEHITIKSPQVFFEINAAGNNNLQTLNKNISSGSSQGSSASSSSGQGGGQEPKLIIRKVLFADGSILATVVPLGRDYQLKLPRIEMKNLGGKNGATPKEITNQILSLLTDQALAEVKRQGIDQYKQQLEGEVNKRVEAEEQKVREKIGDQATDSLKGLLKTR